MSGARANGSRRVTLHDVARATGVSKSTVSRVLDERLPQSRSETARRVREAAEELGYVRDMSAASLRRGTTDMIGVIVPRLTDTVMAMLYEALSAAAGAAGKFTIVATTDDTPEKVARAADALVRRGVEGLVLATARNGDTVAHALAARGVPVVLALRTDGESPSAVGDDRLGGYLATRHLTDLGHERIGLIAGPGHASSATGRREGYEQALVEAGLLVDPALVIASDFSIDAGIGAVQVLMAASPRPTALFAVNDNTAIGAISGLAAMNLSVPDDISVVGYNDTPLVSHLPTPLTSVRVPFDQIAADAMALLADPGAGPAIRRSVPTLIPRRSTKRPR